MALLKRNNTWHYSFSLNGKAYRGTTKKTIKADALLVEKTLKESLKTSTDTETIISGIKKNLTKGNVKVSEIWELFKPSISSQNKVYIASFESRVKKFTNFLESKNIVYVYKITEDDIKEFVDSLNLNAMAVRTAKDYIGMYTQLFNYCKKQGYIIENYFSDIQIKGLKKNTIHREAFTAEELKLIGEHSKDTYLYPLFITGIFTGLREGDICNLKWSNIDLKQRQIIVKMSKTKETVYIPILDGLYNYLINLEQNSEFLYPVLQDKYNKQPQNISKDVTKFLNSIGITSSIKIEGRKNAASIKDIHSLRHTFAYIASINNVPFSIVQSLLGHMDSNMTKMYMNHATIEAKRTALKTLPNYLHPTETEEQINIKDLVLSLNAENWQEVKEKILQLV